MPNLEQWGPNIQDGPARMSSVRCGSFGMLLSCAQGPLGWRLAQAAGGLRALREAGVDLEIAKNLAWHRAGGQRASLAAEGSAALLRNGAPFPCAWLREVTAACPKSSGTIRGSLVSRGEMLMAPTRSIRFCSFGEPVLPLATGWVPILSWGTGGSSLASAGGSNAPS